MHAYNHIRLQLFEILLPGCENVIPSVDAVTRDRLRNGFTFFTALAEELSRRQAKWEDEPNGDEYHRSKQPKEHTVYGDEYYQDIGGDYNGYATVCIVIFMW